MPRKLEKVRKLNFHHFSSSFSLTTNKTHFVSALIGSVGTFLSIALIAELNSGKIYVLNLSSETARLDAAAAEMPTF